MSHIIEIDLPKPSADARDIAPDAERLVETIDRCLAKHFELPHAAVRRQIRLDIVTRVGTVTIELAREKVGTQREIPGAFGEPEWAGIDKDIKREIDELLRHKSGRQVLLSTPESGDQSRPTSADAGATALSKADWLTQAGRETSAKIVGKDGSEHRKPVDDAVRTGDVSEKRESFNVKRGIIDMLCASEKTGTFVMRDRARKVDFLWTTVVEEQLREFWNCGEVHLGFRGTEGKAPLLVKIWQQKPLNLNAPWTLED